MYSTIESDQVSAGSPLLGLSFLACVTLVLQYVPFQGILLNILLQKNISRSTSDKCLECSVASFFRPVPMLYDI